MVISEAGLLSPSVEAQDNGFTKSVLLRRVQVELSKSSPSSRAAKVLQTVAKYMLQAHNLLHSWPWYWPWPP